MTLSERETKWNKTLTDLNNKLVINTQKEDKSSKGKLILQVMNEVAGNVNLDVTYITNSASWQPFYDLRAENINSPINLMYKAKVMQSTGIDWKKVKLTLSSGNPNQNNVAPLLQAWFLRYGYPANYGYQNVNAKANSIQSLQGRVAGLEISSENGQPGASQKILIRGAASLNENSEPLYVVDGAIVDANTFRN